MSPVDIQALVRCHTKIQLGSFFSHDEEIGFKARFAWSDTIEDSFWNYAYNIQTNFENLPSVIEVVRGKAAAIGRLPSIYITPESTPRNLDRILPVASSVEDSWMVRSLEDFPFTSADNLKICEVRSLTELRLFLEVFRAAYGQSSDVGEGVGYSGLPETYPAAIASARPADDVSVIHFLGCEDDVPAAIASIYSTNTYAGLYSVGVAPKFRRQGYGFAISIAALKRAQNMGKSIAFLQTEPDSAVERLYEKLGFRREFVGTILTLR